MLNPAKKYEIFDMVPTSFYGGNITAQRINKIARSGSFENPVIAVEFVNDNLPYYSSIDDYAVIDGSTLHKKEYMRVTLRLIVGASDTTGSLTTPFIYKEAQTRYRLAGTSDSPIVSDGTTTFIKDTDYSIINNIYIDWLTNDTPDEDAEFSATYDTTMRGSWIVDQILYELNTWTHSTLNMDIHIDDISVINRTTQTDLSRLINQDAVTVRAFDVTLVYPDSWDIELGDMTTPLETIDTTFI